MQSEQFLRISRLIGDEYVAQLQTRKILVVGLGAVGGMCLESLARSGIGTITLVDFDIISITNLGRQILATHQTLGKKKSLVAMQRVMDINPECKVKALDLFCNKETLPEIFSEQYDLVIDAIDSLNPKCDLLQYCYVHDIPIVSSMGAALRRNPFLVRTADLFDTYGCPLAKQVRNRLRRRNVGKGISVVFSPEIPRFTYKTPEEETQVAYNEQSPGNGRTRNVLGSLPTVTGIFGLNLAHLALSKLTCPEIFTGEAAFDARTKVKTTAHSKRNTPQPEGFSKCLGTAGSKSNNPSATKLPLSANGASADVTNSH
ncbi:MAG: tRNA threonylcarbamoyladenosine dehydratase [Spirochaetia bacterium]|nr:tRNA threonylcarbamoyladenosine dehydratase [Spirochaetia bacterium]